MEDKAKTEARRWLSRQLAWEASLDRLVKDWENDQGIRRHPSAPAPRRRTKKPGLPLEKPAA